MANIRVKNLPAEATPNKNDLVPLDNATTRAATIEAIVNAGRPFASQAEAEAGVIATKAMNPLTTKQALAAQGALIFQPFSPVLSATTASFTTADETKLDGVEDAADVTDAANVAAAGAVMESDTSTAAMGFVIDENDMASDSDTKVPTQQSVKAYVDANTGGGGQPFVLLATGQSNATLHPPFAWTPPPNVFLWNWDGTTNAATDIGTAFTAMPSNSIGAAWAYAAEVARANPSRPVYLVNIGISGIPISKWMTGAPTPDMYAACKNNVQAALSVIGATQIDEIYWWQGEHDAQVGLISTYLGNFETVMARFYAEAWCPSSTPLTIMALSPWSDTANRELNNVLKVLAQRDPKRTFVDTSSLPQTAWGYLSNDHPQPETMPLIGELTWIAVNRGKGAAPSGWVTVRKAKNTARVSTVVLASDPVLKFPVRAGKSYTVRAKIFGGAVGGAGLKFGFAGPAPGLAITKYSVIAAATTVLTSKAQSGAAYMTGEVAVTGTAEFVLDIDMLVVVAATAGEISFQFAQNASSAASSQVYGGSFLEYCEFDYG